MLTSGDRGPSEGEPARGPDVLPEGRRGAVSPGEPHTTTLRLQYSRPFPIRCELENLVIYTVILLLKIIITLAELLPF